MITWNEPIHLAGAQPPAAFNAYWNANKWVGSTVATIGNTSIHDTVLNVLTFLVDVCEYTPPPFMIRDRNDNQALAFADFPMQIVA